MSIIRIRTHGDHADIECSKTDGEAFLKTSATWDRHCKAWLIPIPDIPIVKDWLQRKGHTVIGDPDLDKGLPQPLAIGTILEQIAARGPTGSNVYARGLGRARAALQIANATAETARREWAAANPDKHPWSPEANRYVMTRAADASNATLDAIELADLTDEEQP